MTHMSRLGVLTAMVAALVMNGVAAQAWPNKPVTVVTPLAAGTASDVAVRLIAEQLADSLHQAFIVENLPAASGAVGAERVAQATPDGYTICGCNNAILGVLPNLRKVCYDPAKSFRPVGMIAVLPTVLVVNPELPIKSVADLIAYAKAKPGVLNYATGGPGSAQHIAMALFIQATGVQLTHVPYKGASPAAVGVAGGEAGVMFNAVATVMPLVKAGKLRAIAVAGAERTPIMPELPTVAESGVPGYDYASWIGIVAPAATPDAVVDKLASELTRVLKSPATVKRLTDQGIDPFVLTPTKMAEYMATDYARMTRVVKDAGMEAN
ncbi:tripartite tricarboxylate transporter substrate binding protein [soil metagenome]